MDIANLIIRVTNEGLDAATRELDRISSSAEGAKTSSEKFSKSISTLNKVAMVGFGALTAVVGGSIKTAMSFETAMAEVNKTVDFTTSNGLANLKTELEDLSKTIPLTFEELASIAAAGGQVGVADTALRGFTETIAKMAIAFDITADETATSMAKIASNYRIPIEDVGNLGDAINTLSNSTAANAGEIIDFMLRVGGTAKQLNITGEAAAAMGALLVDSGKTVEVAGTAVAKVLSTIGNQDGWSKSQIAAFDSVGLATKEFSELASQDGVAAMQLISDRVMALSSDKQMGALSGMFDIAGEKASELFLNSDRLVDMLDMVGAGAIATTDHLGSMQEEFEAMADTTANAFTLLQNSARIGAAALGEAFLPAVREIAEAIMPMVQDFAEWAKANPELVVTIVQVTGAVLGAIIAVAAISTAITTVMGVVTGLTAIAGFLAAEVGILAVAFTSPLMIIGLLIAAGIALYMNWDKVAAYGKALWADIVYGFGMAVDAANEFSDAVVAYVVDAFNSAVNAANSFADGIVNYVVGAFNSAVDAANNFADMIVNYVVGGFNSAVQSANSFANGIVSSITNGFNIAVGAVAGAITTIVGYFSTNFPAMTSIVTNQFNLIKTVITTVLDVIKAVVRGDFSAIPKIMGDGLRSAVGIVQNIIESILNVFRNAGTKLFSIGKDFISGFINGIKSMAGSAVSAASGMVGSAINAVRKRQDSASPSKVTTKLGKDFSQGMANGITKGKKAVVSEAQKMTESAIKAVQNTITSLQKDIDLFGNESKVTELDYNVKRGDFAGVPQAMLDKQRALTVELEATNNAAKEAAKSLTALDSVNSGMVSGIASLEKSIALFGDSTALASLQYDILNSDKYKGADEEKLARLQALTLEYQNLEGALQAAKSIQERFDKLEADKKKADADLSTMLKGIEDETPAQKLENEYLEKLAVVEKYEQLHSDMTETSAAARLETERWYMEGKRDLLLTQGEALFGNLADLAKGFAGEQSGIYKALFAVEKGFAIAQSAIAIQQSVAKAMAVGFPANIPIIGQAVAMGAGIMSKLKGISPKGFKAGGYTGNGGSNKVAGFVHGKEYVFDAQATKDIGVDNLNAIRSGRKPYAESDGAKVIVNNYSSAKIESRTEKGVTILEVRDEIKKSWTQVSNPNSYPSKMINQNTNATRRRQ